MKLYEQLPLHAYIREYNWKEEYAHLPGIGARCHVCHTPISTTCFDLSIPLQRIDGHWQGGLGVSACSYEHALELLQDYHYDVFRPQVEQEEEEETHDERLPSTCLDDVWIYAYCMTGNYPVGTARSGKWLIFLSPLTIDRYWQAIREAIEQGELGDIAKVTTKQGRGGKELHVICVYTYDYTDKEDVFRIREKLRNLGIRKPISYKADEDTHFLRYKENYSSKYKA